MNKTMATIAQLTERALSGGRAGNVGHYGVTALDGRVDVWYRGTNVVMFDTHKNTVTFRTRGWDTPTTKNVINAALFAATPRYHVFQKDYVWYINTPDGVIDFYPIKELPVSL